MLICRSVCRLMLPLPMRLYYYFADTLRHDADMLYYLLRYACRRHFLLYEAMMVTPRRHAFAAAARHFADAVTLR